MKLSRLKHYIKQYIPYQWVLKYEDKHNFHVDFEAWEKSGDKTELDKQCKFDSIVAVQGFGYSGSGAVVDLLREYDDCLVQGEVEWDCSKASVNEGNLREITFVTEPGGLVDIDKHIDTDTPGLGGEVLNRFAMMMYRNRIYNLGIEYKKCTFRFFSQLFVDKRIMNGSLSPIMRTWSSRLYTPSSLSKMEYYELSKRYLYSLFNLQYREGKRYLVLDQFFQATMLHPDYNKRYLPNLKSIVVYRDPRDIYYIAKTRNIPWLEHDTVEHFIRRVERQYRDLDLNSSSYLALRFEDLVLDYDSTVKIIEKYIGLGKHSHPQSCLDISISSKNVGRWKDGVIPMEDFDKIAAAFPEYCYNG